jgi:hypothetical protein
MNTGVSRRFAPVGMLPVVRPEFPGVEGALIAVRLTQGTAKSAGCVTSVGN